MRLQVVLRVGGSHLQVCMAAVGIAACVRRLQACVPPRRGLMLLRVMLLRLEHAGLTHAVPMRGHRAAHPSTIPSALTAHLCALPLM